MKNSEQRMARFGSSSFWCLSLATLALIASSCSVRNSSESNVRLHFDFPEQVRRTDRISPLASRASLPETLTEFSCLLVNVFGPGIDSKNTKFGSDLDKIRRDALTGSSCGYPGVVSQTIVPSNGIYPSTTIDLSIPTGIGRVIQVVGVIKESDCALSMAMKNPAWQDSPQGNYYEIGHVTADILGDVVLSLKDDYSAATATGKSNRRVDCYNSDSNDAVRGIRLTAPNGGEFIKDNVVTKIEWTTEQVASGSTATLEYSRDNGASWNPIASSVANSASNSYDWTPLTTGGNYPQVLVRVTVTEPSGGTPLTDQSDAVFSIDNQVPSLTLSGVTASQVIPAGTAVNLTWTASDNMQLASQPIKLEYLDPSTSTWTLIADQEANDGAYTWTLPSSTLVATQLRISAKDLAGNVGTEVSPTFTINNHQTLVNITSPTTGDYVSSAVTKTITWTVTDAPPPGTGTASVEYSLNGGTSWNLIASANTGTSQSWTPPAGESTNVKIRVRFTDGFGVVTTAISNAFVLDNTAPTVTLGAQPASEYPVGSVLNIAWTASDNNGVKANSATLKYSDGSVYTIVSGQPVSSNYNWTLPFTPVDTAMTVKIQVEDLAGNIGEVTSTQFVLLDVLSGILSMDAGKDHTCVLIENGDIRCWGDNTSGQLGSDPINYAQSNVPLFTTSLANQDKISAGGSTSAVYVGTQQYFWGANDKGNYGNNTTVGSYDPLSVGHLGVAQLEIGNEHTCAVKDDQTIECWGYNQFGSLGAGLSLTQSYLTPQTVSLSGVVEVSMSAKGSCARTLTGDVWCWGNGGLGQLGNGTTTNSNVPVKITALSNVQRIASGDSHSCALLVDNTVKCWGSNGSGQLGNGTTTSSTTPVQVTGGNTFVQIAAGGNQTCGRTDGGLVRCWGAGYQTTPQPVNIPVLVNHITLGYSHGCARSNQGWAYCWGAGTYGQLGDGTSSTFSGIGVSVKFGNP